jgi:DNA end-binding protein Ku
MARSIWKGSISFGLVNIPVGLYTAEQSNDLSFTQLDSTDMAPIGYKRVNKRTGKEVEWGNIIKGYEHRDGKYVIMTDEDFVRANAEAARTVEIVDFVDASEIDPSYFEKPYYLAPMKGGSKGYALLRETLKRTGKIGIAKVVIRTREYLGAVISRGPLLLLEIMRYSHEIRSFDDLELPDEDIKELGLSEKELKMAEMLVASMVEPFDPSKYRDTFREDILALIEKRVEEGKALEVNEEPVELEEKPASDVVDIMSLLKRSVDEKKERKTQTGARKPSEEDEAEEAPAKKKRTRKSA